MYDFYMDTELTRSIGYVSQNQLHVCNSTNFQNLSVCSQLLLQFYKHCNHTTPDHRSAFQSHCFMVQS